MANKERYFEGVGRRKTAIARVRVEKGTGEFVVNEKPIEKYFPVPQIQANARLPLKELNLLKALSVSAVVRGGGTMAQTDAVRHGLARALVEMDEAYKTRLRTAGYLTRDPRMVERKKYGLKKARRAPQWAKR